MQLDAKNIKDVQPYLDYYVKKGLATNLLEQCNHQTFNFIDGAGEGYFITTNTKYTTGATVTFTLPGTALSVVLSVLDVIEIEHPDATLKTRILRTAEEKNTLSKSYVSRNYNVIHRRTQIFNTFALVAPDEAGAKTLQQILYDILPGLTYTGPVIYPYDVFIQGMTVLAAVDLLCSAYGLVWCYQASAAYVYTLTTATLPTVTKASDIQNYIIATALNSVIVGFPILDCCQQYPNVQHDKYWNSALQGESLTVYMPFYYAIYDNEGNPTNETALGTFATNLKAQLQAVERVKQNYLALERYEFINLTAQPKSLKLTYGDYGSGPRTLYSGKEYPYVQSPYKISKPLDRQARNWVGYLQQTYKGAIAGFFVVPSFGIDGLTPETRQYVTNLYKWNYGAAGAAIRVEWDCVNYRWIPLQQEYVCPPSEDPPAPDGPEESPGYNDPEDGIGE